MIHHSFSDLPDSTKGKIHTYVELLLKWNKKINLIADENQVWERHIADSLQLAKYFPQNNPLIADLGAGAGLPGILLSIVEMGQISLFESDKRKTLFLSEALRETSSSAKVFCQRVEEYEGNNFDVVTARALAPLRKLLSYSEKFLLEDGICIFPKGKNYSIEIEEAQKDWSFDYETHPSATSEDSVILLINNLKRC